MALQRVTMGLTELRCIAESDGSGSSEPYLWVTYFALGAQPLPGQAGPVATITPAYDAFRSEFRDGVEAGDVLTIPPFLASASFDMDLDADHTFVGCIAVLMEEDDTPQSSIVLGRIAYAKEIEAQLNELVHDRLVAGDFGPVTDAEIDAIRAAVQAKVEAAVGSNQSLWDVFRNQDDQVGFTYKTFDDDEIRAGFFDFPEIRSDDSTNRYVLSGSLSVGAVPTEPVDLCATPRGALHAKQDEIAGLQTRRELLQAELQHAAPQQKAAIVAEIGATNDLVSEAEAELPSLQQALDDCIAHHAHHDHDVVVAPPVVVDPS